MLFGIKILMGEEQEHLRKNRGVRSVEKESTGSGPSRLFASHRGREALRVNRPRGPV